MAGKDTKVQLVFTSTLGPEHKPELERLLFFNENQWRVVESVAFIVGHYGVPRVQRVGDRLRIFLGAEIELQALFVFERTIAGAPIGVVAYTREGESLVVPFVAVDEGYSSRGSHAGRMLLVKIVDELKGIAGRVRGVSELKVYLGRREPMRIGIAVRLTRGTVDP